MDLLKMIPLKILLNFRKLFLYITIRILSISFRTCGSSLLSTPYRAFLQRVFQGCILCMGSPGKWRGGGNEKFYEAGKKIISAEPSEVKILMGGHFSWGKNNKISVENI